MWLCLVLNVLLGSALLAAVGIIFARRAKSPQASQKKPEAEEPFDAKRQLRELIEGNAELQNLYEKLGYSARLDRESKRIIAEMKAAIRTEIPDFAAFAQVLDDVRKQATDREAKVQYQAGDDGLLGAVLAVGDDQTRILELLNRDPVYEQLPFIEQIPINKTARPSGARRSNIR